MTRFTKAWLWFYVVMTILFLCIVFAPAAHTNPEYEPPVCGVRILPNGLVETLFDIDGDGRADWMTLSRRTRDQKKNSHPLFFGYVPGDEDGLWNVVYIDREEDGWNGNEEIYFEEK